MLDLDKLDVEEIAEALADQTDYEHRWLIDPTTGQVAFWTSDTGIDARTPSRSMSWTWCRSIRCPPTSGTRTWRISLRASATSRPADA
jgi:hypothetical protein